MSWVSAQSVNIGLAVILPQEKYICCESNMLCCCHVIISHTEKNVFTWHCTLHCITCNVSPKYFFGIYLLKNKQLRQTGSSLLVARNIRRGHFSVIPAFRQRQYFTFVGTSREGELNSCDKDSISHFLGLLGRGLNNILAFSLDV